jgi:tRNA 5-methylaminomethyl-2-thiouridine biosynthesis bifunctional protein
LTRSIHLDIASGSSQIFLRAWQAWRANPQRARMLHVVAICPGKYSNEFDNAELKPLAEQLDAQLWGLLPGFHRLVLEGGQVLLTLCIGDVAKLLRQQQFEADVIDLNSATLAGEEALYAAKAIARLSRPGTVLTSSNPDVMKAALKQCGFVFDANLEDLRATYNPAWVTKMPSKPVKPSTCMVVGAGLAGAAMASSLARRGWQVTVLDSASQPASGASSLPAGLLVPHTSPDDSPLSRLSRCGVRTTLQQCRALLRHGTDWGHTGVLQRSFGGDKLNLPPAWAQSLSPAASDWCSPATPTALTAAGLPADSQALWHAQAGWVKPAALVNAWLAAPGIEWRGNMTVARLAATDEGWQAHDVAGNVIASADMVVLAAAYASHALATGADAVPPDLQAIRGQVTYGSQNDSHPLPPFAVNGHGGLIPGITTPSGPMWLMGAGYERDVKEPSIKAQDHADNLARLQVLLPQAAAALTDQFDPNQAHGWAGIRCATPNRLPLVSRAAVAGAGLWLCTGMGSRGLTFAALCGELLAAQLHGEPLPVDRQLAVSLMGNRF